jgi:hypothetical protein
MQQGTGAQGIGGRANPESLVEGAGTDDGRASGKHGNRLHGDALILEIAGPGKSQVRVG